MSVDSFKDGSKAGTLEKRDRGGCQIESKGFTMAKEASAEIGEFLEMDG